MGFEILYDVRIVRRLFGNIMNWRGYELRPHQIYGVEEVKRHIQNGSRRIVLTSPTGGGKTVMIGCLLDFFVEEGLTVDVYNNRKLLSDQSCGVAADFGFDFGVRASGKEHLENHHHQIQFVMMQTDLSREKRRAIYQPRKADVVIVDEAHNMWGGSNGEFLKKKADEGSIMLYTTASPVGCKLDIANILVVAGRNSDMRKCGAHVPCHTYEPDVPKGIVDLRPTKTGEYREGDVVKAIMSPTIHARVIDWLKRINPDLLPSIGFGPSVDGSIYFAEECQKAGIDSAHIDGEHVWIKGKTYTSSPELRQTVLDMSKSGEVKIVWNRYVMREGIDAPWLAHCVLATAFGSVTSYIQSVGRLLRSYPGLEKVTLQDHGGNFRRHGSPNADREWVLGQDARDISRKRMEAIRNPQEQGEGKKEHEGIVCRKCGAIRLYGPVCVTCGYASEAKGRYVEQRPGELKFVYGDVYHQRKVSQKSDTQKAWDSVYWAMNKSGRTFQQGYAWFFRQYGYWPPKTLANMPVNASDWYNKVNAVEYRDLIKT